MKNGEGKNLPEKKFRAGAISVTIWRNETEKGSFNSVQLGRSYKDKQDKWQNTSSLRFNDLPKAALLLNKAYEYLIFKGKESDEVSEQEVPVESVM